MDNFQSPEIITHEIREANKRFMKAFNANDPEELSKVYTENGKLFPPNGFIIQGREGIRNFWKEVFTMGIKKAQLKTEYAEGFNNTAIEEGKYIMCNFENEMIDQGKYIVIWKKEDGIWKYDRDIWNTSLLKS